MIGNGIIACIVFSAFFRAAQEYNKNGLAWGAIGVFSFFIPYLVIPIVAAILLTSSGAGSSAGAGLFSISAIAGFGIAVAVVIWVYNKLMERAIDEQAALDSQVASQGGSQNR